MHRHTAAAAAALVAALGGAAAIAIAAVEPGDTIQACRNLRHGLVRIAVNPSECKRNEVPLAWSTRGPAGPKGDSGPAGAKGDTGPAGPKGDPGGGLADVDALAGTGCTTFDGSPGHVEVGATATDLITLTCETGTASPPTGSTQLVINEVDYDQVGADTDGFVEIANAGSSPATLDGIALVLVNGGDGTEYQRKALTGTVSAGGYVRVDVEPQNGAPDGLALVDTGSAALLDALSYEGAIHSATIGGATYDLVEGTMLPIEVTDSNTVEGTLARIPDRRDANDAATDWAFTTTPTPGAANVKTG